MGIWFGFDSPKNSGISALKRIKIWPHIRRSFHPETLWKKGSKWSKQGRKAEGLPGDVFHMKMQQLSAVMEACS